MALLIARDTANADLRANCDVEFKKWDEKWQRKDRNLTSATVGRRWFIFGLIAGRNRNVNGWDRCWLNGGDKIRIEIVNLNENGPQWGSLFMKCGESEVFVSKSTLHNCIPPRIKSVLLNFGFVPEQKV
jgi:hypothetical protein